MSLKLRDEPLLSISIGKFYWLPHILYAKGLKTTDLSNRTRYYRFFSWLGIQVLEELE